jgi:SAM-dependent methyltransferase
LSHWLAFVVEVRVFRGTAHIYDLIYQASGKDYAAEAREVDAQIRGRNPTARSLLDVACGTGGHLRHLRDVYEVAGVDIDQAMLDEAQTHLPGVELVEADMRQLAVGRRFDAVVCLFSSIGYMTSTGELNNAVAAMGDHLTPGGVLIIDGWVRPAEWIDPGTTHVEVAETEGLKVVRVGRSLRAGKHTRLEMHHLVASLDRIDHIVDEHVLTLFSDDEYRSAFVAAGLGVTTAPSPMPGRDRYIGQAPSA